MVSRIFKDHRRFAHQIPSQTEIVTEELSPKSLYEVDFAQLHIQILHHLKIVHKDVITTLVNQTVNVIDKTNCGSFWLVVTSKYLANILIFII